MSGFLSIPSYYYSLKTFQPCVCVNSRPGEASGPLSEPCVGPTRLWGTLHFVADRFASAAGSRGGVISIMVSETISGEPEMKRTEVRVVSRQSNTWLPG